MSTNVHITHIENAWAAWYANGDHGQISILTDAATGLPYEEFTWKNDDDSKTYIAAAQKYSADGSTFTYLDSDFDALTSQDDTDGFSTAQWIRRIGDTDNRIQLETDEQTYHVGGVDMMNFVEGATDLIEFNPGEVDVDFIVNSLSVSEALSVQGNTGYVGMSMTPATATLSIKANASHYNIDMVENSGADSWQIGVPADGYLELSDDTVHRVRFTETDINNYSYATGGFYGRCSSDTPAEYSRLRLSKTHADTNISTSAGESLCNMIFGGVDNGGNEDTGVIIAVTQVGAAGTKVPTKFELYTSTNAATNLALTIDESQSVFTSGMLGAGMTPATAMLDVKANASHYNIDMVANADSKSWQMGVPANGYLEFSDDTIMRVRFTETDIYNYSYSTGGYFVRCLSDTPADYARLRLSKRHTDASATASGESLCSMIFGGVDNGGNEDAGAIITVMQVGAAGAKVPSKMEMYTSTSTATNLALTIDESQSVFTSGMLGAGMTPATAMLDVKANASHYNINLVETGIAAQAWQIGVTAAGALELSKDTVAAARFMTGFLQLESLADNNSFRSYCYSDNIVDYPSLVLRKSHQDTEGLTETIDTEVLGKILFEGVRIGGVVKPGAQIIATQDGTGTGAGCKIEIYSAGGPFAEYLALTIDRAQHVFLSTIRSGATQGGASAAANELWKTASHATLPDNVVMIGV